LYRSIPEPGLTAKLVIDYYLHEVVNVMIHLSALPNIYILCFAPLPLAVAQFAYVAHQSFTSLLFALSSTAASFR